MTKAEVADEIENFINGTGGPWDWDDFTSIRINDPYLDEIRERCGGLIDEFPPTQPGHYCNSDGIKVMRRYVLELRAEKASPGDEAAALKKIQGEER